MAESRLIELSYYDPKAETRLTAYADTIVLDHNEKGGIISAYAALQNQLDRRN